MQKAFDVDKAGKSPLKLPRRIKRLTVTKKLSKPLLFPYNKWRRLSDEGESDEEDQSDEESNEDD